MTNPAEPAPSAPRPVFAIFEGGGARGIAHLGAAAAAEEEGLDFVGVAGASAGAFVAALLAAGYRGRELFNPETQGSDLLSRYGKSPIDLLDADRWAEIRILGTRLRAIRRAGWPKRLLLAGRTMLRFLRAVLRVWTGRGYFDTAGVRDFVNWALREKLLDAYAAAGLPEESVPDRICFKHLDIDRFPGFRPLKIIATDINAGQAALFSQTSENAGVEVGAAVAASVAIPIVFRPAVIDGMQGRLFADGGLVSNLPAWTFVEEKLAYERRFPEEDRVPILAFTLAVPEAAQAGDGQAAPAAPSMIDYLMAVGRAGVFGSQALSQKLITDLLLVTLRPELDVLGFDATWHEILGCFNAGRRDAARYFARSLRLRPDRVRSELRDTVLGLKQRIDTMREADGMAPIDRVRGAIIAPAGPISLRVMVTYGTDSEADDNLLLDRKGPGCARAFRERDIVVVQVGRDAHGHPLFSPAALMTRYEAAMVWPALRSMVGVPIFANSLDWSVGASARAEPLAILSIDSDEDLEPVIALEALRAWLIERSVIVSGIIAKGIW